MGPVYTGADGSCAANTPVHTHTHTIMYTIKGFILCVCVCVCVCVHSLTSIWLLAESEQMGLITTHTLHR